MMYARAREPTCTFRANPRPSDLAAQLPPPRGVQGHHRRIHHRPSKKNIIVNTHATFRWRHGLFSAFDYDQIRLQPDLFICLVDNIEVVHHRLHREHEIDATLKDCMVWREEEILATELLSQSIPGSQFYIMARGRHHLDDPHPVPPHLPARPEEGLSVSFPMSHVVDMPDVLAEIDRFRAELAKHFITFDPGDVDEKLLLERAIAAAREGKEFSKSQPHSFGGSKAADATHPREGARSP
jgi:adenylate kinase